MIRSALFRPDAGKGCGIGHLMRCRSLADALKRSGCQKIDFLLPAVPAITELVTSHGYGVKYLPSKEHPDWDEARILEELTPDYQLIVIDHYNFPSHAMRHLSNFNALICVIDDLNSRDLPADLVIGSPFSTWDAYLPHLRPGGNILFGMEYLILRDEFREVPHYAIRSEIERLLVTFGGEDPTNATQKMVKLLDKIGCTAHLEILLGPLYAYEKELLNYLQTSNLKYTIHKNLKNTLTLLSSVDAAISSGGTTVVELAASGVPMVLVEIATNQQHVLTSSAQLGLCESVGNIESVTADTLKASLDTIKDPSLRQERSLRSQQLVDGKGADRVATALISASHAKPFMKLRSLQGISPSGTESQLIWEWRNDPQTRQFSFHTDPIPWEIHQEWIKRVTHSERPELFLVTVEEVPVGMIRLHPKSRTTAQVSINLAPSVRAHGLGRRALSLACHKAKHSLGYKELLADIKPENKSSIALFEKEDFVKTASSEPGILTYSKAFK